MPFGDWGVASLAVGAELDEEAVAPCEGAVLPCRYALIISTNVASEYAAKFAMMRSVTRDAGNVVKSKLARNAADSDV